MAVVEIQTSVMRSGAVRREIIGYRIILHVTFPAASKQVTLWEYLKVGDHWSISRYNGGGFDRLVSQNPSRRSVL